MSLLRVWTMSESVSKRRFSQFSLIFFAMTSLPGKLVVDVLQIRTTERSFYFLEEYGIVDWLIFLFFFLFILLFVQKKPSNIKHPQHSSSNKSRSSKKRKKRRPVHQTPTVAKKQKKEQIEKKYWRKESRINPVGRIEAVSVLEATKNAVILVEGRAVIEARWIPWPKSVKESNPSIPAATQNRTEQNRTEQNRSNEISLIRTGWR